MVVALFGPWWGGLAASIASARTVIDWGHPFALVLHTVEIISVGHLLRARIPLAAASALSWVAICLPLVGVFYGKYLGLSSQFIWMVGLADLLSGLIAALLTHLIIWSNRLQHLWRRLGADRLSPPSLRNDIFAGTLVVGTLPLYSLLLYNGTALREREEERAKVLLSQHAMSVAACLDGVYRSARSELKMREGLRRYLPAERDNSEYVDIGPGARLWWRAPLASGSDLLPPLNPGEIHFPFDRVLPTTAPSGPHPGALRINPAHACAVNTRNMDSVRIAILEQATGAELISYVPSQVNLPKSGFVSSRTIFYAIGRESSGILEFRRVSDGANTFQRPAYLGGHALSQSGLRVIFYQPAARAYLHAARFQMWAIFLVVSAAIASAAFALWFGRRVTSPVTRLRQYMENVDVAPGAPVLDSAGSDVALEMRPLWNGVHDLQRRTAAALTKSEESASAALAATNQKSDFLATISHEIRTPLNCILGILPRVRAEELSDGQRDAIALVERSGEHLVSILNDVLDFSRIEQGQLELRKEPFETVSLIEEAFEMLVPGAVDKGLQFTWTCSPALPASCHGDPLRIKQILINIGGNAVKFTPAGTVEIDVSWLPGADPEGEGRIVCIVRDTGPGIPDAHLDRLFQPFWQLSQTVGTPPNVGTGLGLSIVKRILNTMGGEIRMDSALGIGTTATVSIPVGVLRQPPKASGMSVVIAGAPSRIRDSISSHVYYLGCSYDVQTALPFGSGAGKGLIVEDSLAAGLPVHSAGSLQSFIDAGWKVAVYQTYPRRFEKEHFRHTPAVEFLAVPPSLRQLREACAQAGGSLANTPAVPGVPDRAARVLVAEDNAENRLVIELLLNRLGCQPRIVNDGAEAWAALQSATFDFAILDLRMPGIDGLALARRIRQKLPAPPKLIALTASAFESDRKLCADAGFDAFLSKPLQESDLRRVLASGENAPASPIGPGGAWAIKNLTSLRALCGEKAEVMIRTVLDDTGSWLASLAVDHSDQSVADRAHKLAGSAMLIGATALASALRSMEEVDLNDPVQFKDTTTVAKRAWDQAVNELDLYPASSPPQE
jgi:signal transduction histidine kinase/CheY-like chemotaxis protein/HPt (histidine-containing phosphotransfer) domain-containing protein